MFTLRELKSVIGSEARSDSVTGSRAAPCIMGNLLMRIKLGADGASGQPGNTVSTYAFSTPHRDRSIVQGSHRSLGENLIETVRMWPSPEAFGTLEKRLHSFCIFKLYIS
jgi:hypothetical protein